MRNAILLFAIILAACSADERAATDEGINNSALVNDDTAINDSVNYNATDDYRRYRESQSAQASMARATIDAAMESTAEELAEQRISDLERRLEKLEKEERYQLPQK